MKISLAFYVLCLAIFLCSCTRHRTIALAPECIALNNKGSDLLINYSGDREEDLIKATDFFKQAIQCDSTYLIAYINIANAYDHRKDYQQELTALNKALLFSKNAPSLMTEKAIVFEKLNKLDSARKIYTLARKSFEGRLAIHPKDVNLISGYLLILALTEGKESALRELDKQISSNPELAAKIEYERDFYKDFDKKAFIYHTVKEDPN